MKTFEALHRGCLICITGIDGAGKSTAARGITAELRSGPTSVTYVWGRYRPILLYPFYLLARWFLRGSTTDTDYDEYSAAKSRATAKHSLLSKGYLTLLLVDYWLQVQLKVGLPLLAGRTVICDRYVFDTVIVDVANEFGYSTSGANELMDRYLRYVPAPDITFLLDVPPSVSIERKEDIPDRKYVTERHTYYQALKDNFPIVPIDGTKTPHEIQQQIYDELAAGVLESD